MITKVAQRAAGGPIVITVCLALLLAVGGCTSTTETATPTAVTPAVDTLLTDSAAAMAAVTSARFALTVEGELPAVPVQQAEGQLTATGDAQGSGTISQFGQLVEVEFVLIGGELYLKGATGGFAKVPSALAGNIYDPSVLLNPETGVSAMLSSVQNASITGTEGDAWQVSGTVPAAVAAGLVPGISSDVTAVLTIAMSGSQLTAAKLTVNGEGGAPATITVQLSEFNEPVTISPPG